VRRSWRAAPGHRRDELEEPAVVVAPRVRRSGGCKAASGAHVGRLSASSRAGFASNYAAPCTGSTENSNCASDAIRRPLLLSTADGFVWTSPRACCPRQLKRLRETSNASRDPAVVSSRIQVPSFDHEDSSLAAQRPRCDVVIISSPTWRPVALSQRQAGFCCLRIWRPGAVSICTSVELHPGHPVNEMVSLPTERPRAHTGEW
jgi:hypothetical protein